MKRTLKKLITLLNEGGNKDRIEGYKEVLIDSIDETIKEENFYKLPTNEILEIIGKSELDDVELLCKLISNMNQNKGKKSALLLNVIESKKATFEECIQIISKFEQCPICIRTGELFSENVNLPETDYEHEIEELQREIEKLKEEKNTRKKTYFPPVTEKPSDFESDICKAAAEGKLTSVQYLIEQCHANVETKDKYGGTPINFASFNGHLEIVKYLYETCHATITDKTLQEAELECKEYLLSKQ